MPNDCSVDSALPVRLFEPRKLIGGTPACYRFRRAGRCLIEMWFAGEGFKGSEYGERAA